MTYPAVLTERLELHTLSPAVVASLVEGKMPVTLFDIEHDTFEGDRHVLGMRHAQLTADPAEEPWLYRVALLRGTRQVVGRIGFHAPPDSTGAVEIGYSTAAAHRGRGFATEMARGLLAWGAAQGARTCLASARPDNAASLAIIEKLGFVRTGEQMDDIDGLEWVYALDLLYALGPDGSRAVQGGFA